MKVKIFNKQGQLVGPVEVAKVTKTDAQWHAQLSALSYRVTRQEGTESAFSGEYAGNHADGIYRCICCDTALYDSKTKYESGTGWPSFWSPMDVKNVKNLRIVVSSSDLLDLGYHVNFADAKVSK